MLSIYTSNARFVTDWVRMNRSSTCFVFVCVYAEHTAYTTRRCWNNYRIGMGEKYNDNDYTMGVRVCGGLLTVRKSWKLYPALVVRFVVDNVNMRCFSPPSYAIFSFIVILLIFASRSPFVLISEICLYFEI